MAAIGGIGAIGYGGDYAILTNKTSYSYIVVFGSDLAAAGALGGGVKALVYKDGMGLDNNANSTQETMLGGVPLATAQSNGWVLKNTGVEIIAADGTKLADVGNVAYQNAWISNVKTWLLANGGQGVYIDNLLAQYSNLAAQPQTPTSYTDATWEDAQVAFIQAVYTSFHASGLFVAANVYKSGANDPNTFNKPYWTRVAPYLDLITCEFSIQTANDYRLRAAGSTINYNYFWDEWMSMQAHAISQGKSGAYIVYGGQDAAHVASTAQRQNYMRYARGSHLLDWNGGPGALIFSQANGTDPWDATNWTFDTGQPLSAKTQPLTSVWKRQFRQGLIYVNTTGIPSPDTPTTSGPLTTGGSLLASTTYRYRVSATNAAGETLPGPELAYTTPAGTNTNQITINWTAQFDQSFVAATGYKVYRGTTSGSELLLATLGAVTSYVDNTATTPSGAMPTTNSTSSKTVDAHVIPAMDALWVPGFIPYTNLNRTMMGAG